jgi:hypothetical protein
MSRRVRVHQFILTELTRPRSQNWRACDLFGVSHWLGVPEDAEFPYTMARLQLFTRFYLDLARPTIFRVRVLWEDNPTGRRRKSARSALTPCRSRAPKRSTTARSTCTIFGSWASERTRSSCFVSERQLGRRTSWCPWLELTSMWSANHGSSP